MIPADVASRLQISAEAALRPVAPAQELSDKLAGLVAGQKVMAEIQAMLPNGTYRALINQRNVTLALPFSAKSGDALELQVTESDGKLALAVVSSPDGEGGKPVAESASATLSRTGQLISTLFSAAREAKGGPVALPLNSNEPIASAPPNSAQDLLPMLKQAITQSGMFYESHQAEWVEGRFAKAALLQEPQGKLSSPLAFTPAPADEQSGTALFKVPVANPEELPTAPRLAAADLKTGLQAIVGEPSTNVTATSTGEPVPPRLAATDLKASVQANIGEQSTKATVASNSESAPPRLAADVAQTPSAATDAGKTSSTQQAPGQLVAPQVQPIVQQQLEALATQNFSWQGQVWPGQEMRWEIDEDAAQHGREGDDTTPKWSTRLNLTLPNLGEVNAQIRLQGNQITLAMSAGNAETRALMRASSVALRRQLDEAGLTLAAMGVDAGTEGKSDGQA